jgi:hypothetical protein
MTSRGPKRAAKKKGNGKTPGFEPAMTRGAGPAAHGIRVGFPAERTVTLNYCDYDKMTASTGVLAKYQFRLNSCFDPDFTGTGHQPMGFDQWAAYYNHYVVESVDYEVQLAPTGTVYTYTATYISDDTTVPLNYSEIQELGGVVAMGVPYASVNTHIFKGTVNIGKFFNRENIASDNELRALTTANPTEIAYLSIYASNADIVTGQEFYFAIKLAYKVRFMEPKDLAPSTGSVPRPLPAAGAAVLKDPDFEYVRVPRKLTVALPAA